MEVAPRQAQKVTSQVLTDAVRKRAAMVQSQAKDSIKENQFYQMAFSAQMEPEAKKAEIAKTLTYAGTREKSRANVKEFESFMEYIQTVRLEMQQELIKLTDVEVMGELKQIYDDLNRELDEWNRQMKPFTDMLDAIYQLRTNDKTEDAYREIKADKAAAVARSARRTVLERAFEQLQQVISAHQSGIASLSEEKAFFGFGGIKQSARQEIAERQLAIDARQAELAAITDELAKLDKESKPDSALGEEFAESKSQLSKLLDTSSPEHQKNQQEMVEATLRLLQFFKDRTGAGREHLARMDKQFDRLKTANRQMGQVAAVLDDAVTEAEAKTQESRKTFETAADGESAIRKMEREDAKMAAEEHVKALASKKREVGETAAELTRGAIQIDTGTESVRNQMEQVRAMNTRGVASAAEQLNVILQGVNMAALNEASQMGKRALIRMNEDTNRIAQKEVVRAAMDTGAFKDDLARAIDDLASYGEVYKEAGAITSQNMAEIRAGLEQLKAIREEAQATIREASSSQADVSLMEGRPTREKSGAGVPAEPFGGIGNG